jgi:carbon storage regulator CsrA
MLVLGRAEGEEVAIQMRDGTLVWVTVVTISRGRVRLGFRMPDDVRVDRKEVYERLVGLGVVGAKAPTQTKRN